MALGLRVGGMRPSECRGSSSTTKIELGQERLGGRLEVVAVRSEHVLHHRRGGVIGVAAAPCANWMSESAIQEWTGLTDCVAKRRSSTFSRCCVASSSWLRSNATVPKK